MDPLWSSAASALDWDTPFELLHDEGTGRWFTGGRLSGIHNLVDRHVSHRGEQPALRWEGEPGDQRILTYRQLHQDVIAAADALAGLGVGVGDRVALHTGLVPEAITAMLACLRLGATFSVMPAVLPSEALAQRLDDLAPSVLVTQDAAWRHGALLPLKLRADEALAAAASVQHTVVIRRTGVDVPWYEGDRWFHDLVAAPRPGSATSLRPNQDSAVVEADHPLLLAYLPNRRGRPVGVVHSVGGLLAYCAAIHRALAREEGHVLWCPAEFSWIACQTHGLLGPLVCGSTAVVYEGMLDTPNPNRAWEIIERHRASVLMATPSLLRAVRRWGDAPPQPEQIASLGLVVTAGEELEPDMERWLQDDLGRGRLPIVNAWGQTELGGIVHADRAPLSERLPDAGLAVLRSDGSGAAQGEPGLLVLTQPWAAAATLWAADVPAPGVHPDLPGVYVTGDRAARTPTGIELLGRDDHIYSVSGQLVSATEVENVLTEHPFVSAAVVVNRSDPKTGRAGVACVVPRPGTPTTGEFARELRAHVRDTLGGLAQPQSVVFLSELPATTTPAALRAALTQLTSSSGPVDQLSISMVELALQDNAFEGFGSGAGPVGPQP